MKRVRFSASRVEEMRYDYLAQNTVKIVTRRVSFEVALFWDVTGFG